MNVRVEKLVFGGQALARTEKGIVLAWNAQPDELAEVEIVKKRRGVLEGVATTIQAPSPDRQPAREKHFLSCSPWQIIAPRAELQWKLAIAREVYQKIGHFAPDNPLLEQLGIVNIGGEYHYRNKMEFSFVDTAKGLSLGFYERGRHRIQPIEGCLLAYHQINAAAQEIVAQLNAQKITARQLKSLIVRSNGEEVMVGLFCKTELPVKFTLGHTNVLQVFFSSAKSPASNPDKLLATIWREPSAATDTSTQPLSSQPVLRENLQGLSLEYGLFSFFQINRPVFSQALEDMAAYVPEGSQIIDFYAGVGAIGLVLSKKAARVTLVDSNPEAIDFAQRNIALNQLSDRVSAQAEVAEKMTALISPQQVLIVDPPRAGLHPRVTQAIRERQPEAVIYLSCNLSTQARDAVLLASAYKPVFVRLYNFFPRTPHIESLLVLKRT